METQMPTIPANFGSMISDFASDLMTTFPEYSNILASLTQRPMTPEMEQYVFAHVLRVYPERIFDILYQNETQFNENSTVCVEYLPNMDFKLLYHAEGVSATTRNAIWKYLQLVLVSIVGCIPDRNMFGETASMFDNVDEKVFQEKLSETIDGIGDFFKHLGENTGDEAHSDDAEVPDLMSEEEANAFFESMGGATGGDDSMFGKAFEKMRAEMPNAEGIHEHLKSLFDGKIGSLAKELAEEIAQDLEQMFGEDIKNVTNAQDLLKKLIKNPKRVMDLMKKIGDKLKQKMKNNEISEQDIMREAGEILGKMKGMTGKDGKEFGDLFKNLAKGMEGLGGMGGLGKAMFNSGAVHQFGRQMAQKERMQAKLERRRQASAKHGHAPTEPQSNIHLGENQQYVFSVDGEEKQEKSSRSQAPPTQPALHELSIDELVDIIGGGDGVSEPVPTTKSKSSKKKKGNSSK